MTDDDKDLGKQLLKTALDAADPYDGLTQREPGPGPNAGPFQPLPNYTTHPREPERNVMVYPLVVSACTCPTCGALFAYAEEFKGGYGASLRPDESPRCPRCLFATAWPKLADLAPGLADAMTTCRWRYDAHLLATEPGGPLSQSDMRLAFIRAADAFWLHGPALLAALEFILGDQVRAGQAAIEGGASGVATDP